MLAQSNYDYLQDQKPARIQHDTEAQKRRAYLVRQCEQLHYEISRHPEKQDKILAALEKYEAMLAKVGG